MKAHGASTTFGAPLLAAVVLTESTPATLATLGFHAAMNASGTSATVSACNFPAPMYAEGIAATIATAAQDAAMFTSTVDHHVGRRFTATE